MPRTIISVTRWQIKPRPGFGWLPNWKWLQKYTIEEVEVKIDVDVEGEFLPGEPETADCSGQYGYVEFRSASVDGMPFKLLRDEKFIAEEVMLADIRDDLPDIWRKNWNI